MILYKCHVINHKQALKILHYIKKALFSILGQLNYLVCSFIDICQLFSWIKKTFICDFNDIFIKLHCFFGRFFLKKSKILFGQREHFHAWARYCLYVFLESSEYHSFSDKASGSGFSYFFLLSIESVPENIYSSRRDYIKILIDSRTEKQFSSLQKYFILLEINIEIFQIFYNRVRNLDFESAFKIYYILCCLLFFKFPSYIKLIMSF